jgi:NAD(P)-dependent dehydrogenase (short-subunit alcohol dehydrogenase family)
VFVCDIDVKMLEALAQEIKGVATHVCDVSKRQDIERMMAVQSLKRLVDPRDIAALAVFLASDAAKSISGQMLPIDSDMQQAS